MGADKKRASTATLALFFSMKVAICCNRCGAESGRRRVSRQSRMSGIATIESLRWLPSLVPHGPVVSACTMNCWTTMRAPGTSSGFYERCMRICVVRSFSSAIASPRIDRLLVGYRKTALPGSRSNGFQRMLRNWIQLKMSGANQSTGHWLTSSRTTLLNCIGHSTAC